MSLRKLEGSFPSPWEMLPFSKEDMVGDAGDELRWKEDGKKPKSC